MEAIVEAARRGDRTAAGALVDEFLPTALGAAYGLCGDWDRAADIAQEALCTALTHLGDLREPAAFPGWLMAIVRSSARRMRSIAVVRVVEASVPSPEDLVITRDEAARLRLAVERLPAHLRLPMALHYFADRSVADIATLTGVPVSTVKQRMRVARGRLRTEMTTMTGTPMDMLCPSPDSDPTDVVRMYVAMRSGDVERVAALLDARPDLVDVRDGWTRAEGFAHRLPWTRGGGTPLLRAVERGDLPMVRLLLSRGADPSARCTCDQHESPIWVAALQNEVGIAELLLAKGADPDAAAFAGSTPLDVAVGRGHGAIADALVRAGGARSGVAPCDTEDSAVGRAATGIRAVDLLCPFPERGLVHVTPAFGVGAVVLISELSLRAARTGARVVWTGFVQSPTDLSDVHHGLAEAGIETLVELCMCDPRERLPVQLAAMDRGLQAAGDDAFLVVFADTGKVQHVEARLADLAVRPAITVVVAPLVGDDEPPEPDGSPYLAAIRFDPERARRHRWPAVATTSWSKVADPEIARFARIVSGGLTDAVDEYLAQPFFVAEPMTGVSGEHTSSASLRASLARMLTTP
jgi:RNA polymerase sigma-70 factor (ECF subfamily)